MIWQTREQLVSNEITFMAWNVSAAAKNWERYTPASEELGRAYMKRMAKSLRQRADHLDEIIARLEKPNEPA